MRCPRCADAQPDAVRFCSRCGAELAATTPVWPGDAVGHTVTAADSPQTGLPDRPSVARARVGHRGASWLVAALVVGGLGAGTALVVGRFGDSDDVAVGAAEARGPVVTALPPANDPSSATTSSLLPVAGPAVAALRATVEADAPSVEALVGQWVPQVSQRRVGVRNGGLALQAIDIVLLHVELQKQFGAVLLNSSDYVFKTDNMWVSVVPEGFATANEALDRCATLQPADRTPAQIAEQIAEQPCIARLITHDESIAVTSKQRRS